MQDGDAQAAIPVHVGVVDRRGETEGGWGKGKVGGKAHLALEVTAVVHRFLVEHHKANVPQEYVIIFELYLERGDTLFGVGEVSVLPLEDKLC